MPFGRTPGWQRSGFQAFEVRRRRRIAHRVDGACADLYIADFVVIGRSTGRSRKRQQEVRRHHSLSAICRPDIERRHHGHIAATGIALQFDLRVDVIGMIDRDAIALRRRTRRSERWRDHAAVRQQRVTRRLPDTASANGNRVRIETGGNVRSGGRRVAGGIAAPALAGRWIVAVLVNTDTEPAAIETVDAAAVGIAERTAVSAGAGRNTCIREDHGDAVRAAPAINKVVELDDDLVPGRREPALYLREG